MTAQPLDSGYDPSDQTSTGPKMFRKHKSLPHPSKQQNQARSASADRRSPTFGQHDLVDETANTLREGLQRSTSPVSQSRRARAGPAMPPTPPTHSRTSSSSHSIPPPSPILPGTPSRSEEKVHIRVNRPATPPNPTSPPTPDETPPQHHRRPRAPLRPVFGDRSVSKSTTGSRPESFRTAREEPYSSSGEDDSRLTIRPTSSARATQLSLCPGSDTRTKQSPRSSSPGNDTGSAAEKDFTPGTKGEFITFDRESISSSEHEQDLNPDPVSPLIRKSRKTSEERGTHDRRHSGVSSKSNVSTVVEVMLVDTTTPHRPQTLRHVKKRRALRASGTESSPSSSPPSSLVRLEDDTRRPRPRTRPSDRRQDSYASTATHNSVASSKARREIWKSGGIPVVVVPNRRSSLHPPKTPSLRSTSSRKTNRSMSVGSAPRIKGSTSGDATPVFTRLSRGTRALSESDRSDHRTMDYPPIIPARSSSLSAPTSRNNSRAGSMIGESFKAWNDPQHSSQAQGTEAPPDTLQRMFSLESGQEDHHLHPIDSHDKPDMDHYDPLVNRKSSRKNTPFSVVSFDTNGTAPEVSEAFAVSIFPHQNSSILMVDHSPKSFESSDISQKDKTTPEGTPERPKITATAPDADDPVTPPQPHFPSDDVDSPPRNPRSPPQPPAIQFIPATPSGLTPYEERLEKLGNFFDDDIDEPKPRRSTSLVRRAFSRRQRSESCPPKASRPGFLTRTLSLSRNTRQGLEAAREKGKTPAHAYPTVEDPPVEEDKLHPFWRPTYRDYDDDWAPSADDEDRAYRYPPIDNRPRRSLSSRMRRTFAILPRQDGDDYYPENRFHGTDRRTIRRTPSGNLRVMKRRTSSQSLRQRMESLRPSTAPGGDGRSPPFLRRERSGEQAASSGRRRRFSLSHTVGELQELPRRMSERRREKRTRELRQKISRPQEVRDNVGEVIQRANRRDSQQQPNLSISHH
ncbi:hypothetical protein SODALDRAFT_279420 [Sodiomyces alkalinus F11]|uniref:Uncharacterized protein n=1 Tax=Sodiomyces alkalinus (strain CBS 110278 / VKM F-3762 / F11) TaxID=1314773 RepID=A0A3N2PT31_SODAK|nr:hypothetical protein SODALDRAFT_279420 [Sodiomyces alkalinus F11]ROT37679.1 hypothetical protein SODALDRAFT_279420 [Sodiomyces alkalinus F11]